jgi:excisionase family DNA binding protein
MTRRTAAAPTGVSEAHPTPPAPAAAASAPQKLLLRIPEVAELLGVSEATVYRFIDRCGLTTVHIPSGRGGARLVQRVRRSDLEAWVAQLPAASGDVDPSLPAWVQELYR